MHYNRTPGLAGQTRRQHGDILEREKRTIREYSGDLEVRRIEQGWILMDYGQLLGTPNEGKLISRKIDQSVLRCPAL